MTRVIAVTNQKGGVGKTTSSISIAAELANFGYKVLLIDIDPQASATSGLSVIPSEPGTDFYDMFFGRTSLESLIKESSIKGLDVIPSSKDLVGIEIELGKAPGRELILKSDLFRIQSRYDYVFIDCPPSSGLLTLNALGAADSIIIPLQAEYYALEGLTALMGTVEFVRQTFNQRLEILGVFLTMYDSRTNLSSQVQAEATSYFKELMFSAVIPRNIKISESPSHGVPICVYDKNSIGARAYHKLARELDARCKARTEERKVGNF